MTTSDEPPAGEAQSDRLTPALMRVAIYSAFIATLLFVLFPDTGLTIRLFRQQDFIALLMAAVPLGLIAWRRPLLNRPLTFPHRLLAPALALLVFLVAGAGTWLIFGNYSLSRDELLADFDSAFLEQLHLLGTIPPEWRPFSEALMPIFMLPISPESGWLSAYLPGNAALRAIGSRTIGAEWVNPLLAALSVLLVHRIGRKLWPDAPGPALVAVILLASSAQVIAMAMTAYAMTAHLAFNLIWLWAFIRKRLGWDVVAIAAGFVATGLHQFVFHPVFAAPFLVQLWFAGQRWRTVFFAAAYACIGLFWILYWQIALPGVSLVGAQSGSQGLDYLIARVVPLITSFGVSGIANMIFNLLRFLSWQNLFLIPLALLAWPAIRRGEGIARPLAAGIVLTLVMLLILLPWQGHGWGYRYLHGLIGSFCLLAGYGWLSLRAEAGRAAAGLAISTAVTALLILPLHLKQAHDFVEPYRNAYRSIVTADAEVVLVDPNDMLFGEDLVRNRPDLSNRPIIASSALLSSAQIMQLCRHYRVVLFDARHAERAGIQRIGESPLPSRHLPPLVRTGCIRPLPLR